jgi:hypothetical protein
MKGNRLCRGPAMQWIVGDRAISVSADSASQIGRFETQWLSRADYLENLAPSGRTLLPERGVKMSFWNNGFFRGSDAPGCRFWHHPILLR